MQREDMPGKINVNSNSGKKGGKSIVHILKSEGIEVSDQGKALISFSHDKSYITPVRPLAVAFPKKQGAGSGNSQDMRQKQGEGYCGRRRFISHRLINSIKWRNSNKHGVIEQDNRDKYRGWLCNCRAECDNRGAEQEA